MEEDDAFWVMATIVEDILPASYYSSTLLGIQADQRVMQTLIGNYLTAIDETLKTHDIELSLISLNWFLTLFANVVNMRVLFRWEQSSAMLNRMRIKLIILFQNLGLVFLRWFTCTVSSIIGHVKG